MAFLVIVTRIAKVIMVCPGNIENKIRFLLPNSPPANPSALLNFNLVLNVHERYFFTTRRSERVSEAVRNIENIC